VLGEGSSGYLCVCCVGATPVGFEVYLGHLVSFFGVVWFLLNGAGLVSI
jgi:hypothetical protein